MSNYKEIDIYHKKYFVIGNSEFLYKKKIGIFISRKIPLNIVIPVEEFLISLSDFPFVFVGGWHSPFERRILKKLLYNGKDIIFFTSKGIQNQKIYSYLKNPLKENKLLITSHLENEQKITLHSSIKRNETISDITDYNIFLFIDKGGNLEKLYNNLIDDGKIPLIFNHPLNSDFIKKAKPIDINNFKEILV